MCGVDSLPASFRKPRHCPAVFFRRASGEVKLRGALELHLGDGGFAPPDAFLGFFVKRLRLRRGTAQFCDVFYDNGPFKRPAANGQLVRGPDDATRLGARAVDFDFATADGFGGEPARLEKSRGPQPFVDADILVIFLIVHESR